MRTSFLQQLAPALWWRSRGFRLTAAFLLGIPVGFIFRPLQAPSTLLGPIPPFLSLWGAWPVPVVLLGGMMWIKIAVVLLNQKKARSFWKGVGAYIVLLSALFFLVWGIAPLESLQQMHFYLGTWETFGAVSTTFAVIFNPFMVGLAAAFILEDVTHPFFPPKKAVLIGGVAWVGTVTLFLVLLAFYAQVPQYPPRLFHCIGFCSTNPVPLIFNTAPFWIVGGLLLALLGGVIGSLLCHLSLAQRRNDIKNADLQDFGERS